ncbi:glycoside hydrolase family 3 C-terminal domain-containing protein [Enterovibrio sp. ZSDZ35]|uniref:Glycoside hydrolase family 3 C-terminal domain-containing protein n=1 Tax=Enterovibrio qingdaonensis TaxID=2899818 RepID=A0ABT5QLP7_9GAMM|nr:glycoside hydrolase family 3 N-terminal domain-containing protein [Enterovibrio sp. ZSDZ35]MDD1781907.1 glycoside hydrolase family 3 C-terminal domain-containing protein [Enterovibrio sp. ZSDZ35]
MSGKTSQPSLISDVRECSVPYFPDWPLINSAIPKDINIEREVQRILSKMTLEEKVGQMVQPDLRSVTPEEAEKYKLGSILNGGGAWPNGNKYASAQEWAEEADKYFLALENAYQGRGFRVPIMWATDAVHGHNNVFGATVFPHNIGLGAANNPALIKKIGQATAQEVAATGLDWTFAPTVAAPRDYRWGRVYEGYSEDPEIIYQYASQMVEGLQGDEQGLKSDTHVISNVKHWLGDGGTKQGIDRGQNHYTEDYLRNIHATGYFSGLDAGAQVVMTSFNSWHDDANYDVMNTEVYNKKLHGSKYIVNDVLKDKMGFDGLVVTDWNGHSEINGSTAGNSPQAVLAGNDIFMVTARKDWQAFYRNVIHQVNDGLIPMSRIDDAVTRILRVKMRANLWHKPMPSQRRLAGKQEILGSQAHRSLARQAVSESLVLLKNNNDILPLSTNQKYLVVGSAAHDIQKQTGGWSLTWQGTENTLEQDFPCATTMLMAVQEVVGEQNVYTDSNDAPKDAIAIVVIGEDPYAEMFGDISPTKTLEYATLKPSYADDLHLIQSLNQRGFPIITVFFSGRPLYVNEEINLSDAFVAGWLPGTEGLGITDVLFNHNPLDFKGRLSFSWPKTKCATAINRKAPNIPNYQTPETEQDVDGDHSPLFPYGYGLSYGEEASSSVFDLDNLPLDPRPYGCGMNAPDNGIAAINLEIYGRLASGEFVPRISSEANHWEGVAVSNGTPTLIEGIQTTPIDHLHQQDAIRIEFSGDAPAQVYLQTPDEAAADRYDFLNADATLQFDIDLKSPAPTSMMLAMHCGWPCLGQIPIHKILPAPTGEDDTQWTTIKIPLQYFADEGMNFSLLDTAFLIHCDEPVTFNLGEIRFVPRGLDDAVDAIPHDALLVSPLPPLEGDNINLWELMQPNLVAWQAQTSNWQPLHDHLELTAPADQDKTHEFRVSYNKASPEDYKGVVLMQGITQNLTEFAAGHLTFEVFIECYGKPATYGETQCETLVVKMESPTGSGNDYPLGPIETGQWHSISVPISELNTGKLDITKVNKPFATLAEWDASQAGVSYRVRNIVLTKN